MDSAAASLRDNGDRLKAEVIKLRDAVKEKERTLAEKEQALSDKDQRIEQLLDYIVLLRKRQFGASADRPNKDQIPLFDEAELEQLMAELGLSDAGEESASSTQAKTKAPRKKPVRRPLPAHFPRVEKIIDLSDDQKAAMSDDWSFIGYDTSEQLAVIPRQHYVIAYKRAKYVPKHDGVTGAAQGVRIAARPDQIQSWTPVVGQGKRPDK